MVTEFITVEHIHLTETTDLGVYFILVFKGGTADDHKKRNL